MSNENYEFATKFEYTASQNTIRPSNLLVASFLRAYIFTISASVARSNSILGYHEFELYFTLLRLKI